MSADKSPQQRVGDALSGVGFTDEQILALRVAMAAEIEETLKALVVGVRDALKS